MDLVQQLNSSLDGRYAIDREIGRGGMATVYVARDMRHDRSVAVKVLNPELGALLGVDRFIAEIKVTAKLQHPNLVPLFDSGEADGQLYYVMPFIEGESLRNRLTRERQLSVDDAVRIATAVAGALDYAHRQGIIHRDLKPENILLHEGQALVADFGIALAVTNAAETRITQSGMSLGTPQYMSPEQAAGDRTIDGRTDIYALGTLLYEMLTGDPPHVASTAQATVAKVLVETPHPVRSTRPTVPAYVDAAIARALEKVPADRFATAQDFADALAGKFAPATGTVTGAKTVAQPQRRGAKVGVKDAVYGTLILAGAAAFVVAQRRQSPTSQPTLRLEVVLPSLDDAVSGPSIAVSPTGDRIAYAAPTATAGRQLFVRTARQLEPTLLYSGRSNVRTPAFSPDGKWIAFVDGTAIKKISVDGGSAIWLAGLPDVPYGLSWSRTGVIVSGASASGLYVVPAGGGPSQPLPAGRDGFNRWPLVLPDGDAVVYMARTAENSDGRLHLRSLRGGAPVDLGLEGTMPLAFLEGQLIYSMASGTLMAVPFNVARRAITGVPVQVEQDVVIDPAGGAKAALSSSGLFVFRSGRPESRLVLVQGATSTPLIPDARWFSNPRFSPDGKRVAVILLGQSGGIYVFDRVHETLTRITSGRSDSRPEWTPDGRKILFSSDRGDGPAIWWQTADASSPAELLYKPEEGDPYEAMISPDSKWLVYRTGPAGHPPRSIFAIPVDRQGKPQGKPTRLLADSSAITMPRLSPDSHWLAYQSNITGGNEVYVRPFPDSGGRVQVSTETGGEPLWSHSGDVLFYRAPQGIMSVKVTTGASFGLGERKLVLTGDFLTSASHPNYDVASDGSGFLMLQRPGKDVRTIVVQNWVRELTAHTSAPRWWCRILVCAN